MKIKTMLSIRRMNRKIQREALRLKRYKETLTQTVFASDGMPRSPNKVGTLGQLLPVKLDAEKYLDRLKAVRESLRRRLSMLIEKAFADYANYLLECEVLIYRYVYDYNYRQIAQSLNYSVGSIYRFHRTGLLFLGFSEADIHTLECY